MHFSRSLPDLHSSQFRTAQSSRIQQRGGNRERGWEVNGDERGERFGGDMRIVWRRREHLCTRCTAEYVKVNIREVWKTRQVSLYILYLCFWKRRWSYGASTFEMFENFRKICIDFRKFWKISYELLSIPTYFEVSRDWAIDFVVAAGAGWDEFSKTNKRKASDSTEVEVKLHDTAHVSELVLGCINTDRCEWIFIFEHVWRYTTFSDMCTLRIPEFWKSS